MIIYPQTDQYTFIRQRAKTLFSLFVLLQAILLLSCSREPLQKLHDKNQGIVQIFNGNGFTLEQRTSRKEITVAEDLTLDLETSVPENIGVEFPRFSAAIGDFTLKDTRIDPPRMTGSGDNVSVVHHVTYFLEPYLAGTYTIPPMTVSYTDRAEKGKTVEVATKKVEIVVHSLLPADAEQAEIKDIKPPLSLPPHWGKQLLAAGLVLLLTPLVIVGFLFWRKRRSQVSPAVPELRPEDIALQELDRLLAENLLGRGEIKLFHLRISDILRRYIETRFGIKAPDRTTEEFLAELSRNPFPGKALLNNHKTLLADFLSQCDLVKFAKFEPSLTESEKTVVLCREFVAKTKETEDLKN